MSRGIITFIHLLAYALLLSALALLGTKVAKNPTECWVICGACWMFYAHGHLQGISLMDKSGEK